MVLIKVDYFADNNKQPIASYLRSLLHCSSSYSTGAIHRAQLNHYPEIKCISESEWKTHTWRRTHWEQANRPFPSSPGPLYQNEVRCSTFDMEMIFYSHANKTHFHKKGWAPNLVLIQRPGGTRKWPIGWVHLNQWKKWDMKIIWTAEIQILNKDMIVAVFTAI